MITYERSTLNEQRKVYWDGRSSSNDLSSGDGFARQSCHGIHPGNQSLYASGVLRWIAWQPVRNLRGRHLGSLALRPAQAACESVESPVSQLGDPLCRAGCLLTPPSQSVAGEDTGSGNAASRRATLSAVGHAAALTPTSTARTAGGESPTRHHGQAKNDSVPSSPWCKSRFVE